MFTLFFTTIITSFLDSLNPFAISQQFVLQGVVKKRNHILYYIMTIFLTNYLCGLLAYYGLLNPILYFIYDMIDEYPNIVFIVKIALIIILFIVLISSLYKIKHPSDKIEKTNNKIHLNKTSIKPYYLVMIGFLTTLSELSTSLPYFTFLSILFSYQLFIYELFFILLLYNIIYCLPLFLMYIIYKNKQTYFNQFYRIIKHYINRWIPYLLPILCSIVIILLLYTFL